MSFNSLMSVRAFLSVVIVSFFLFSTIPNTTYHNEYFVRDESIIIVNDNENTNSRSEGYDLGIDSIEMQYDSGFFVEDSCPNLDCELVIQSYSNPIQVIIICINNRESRYN